jgi:protein xylosyltransferase
LAQIAERFPNVRMASKRYATIWGGASLLTMLLGSMAELLTMTDWNWDYFLNLSESDYPVK